MEKKTKKNPLAVELGKLRQKKRPLTKEEASRMGKLSAIKRWGVKNVNGETAPEQPQN